MLAFADEILNADDGAEALGPAQPVSEQVRNVTLCRVGNSARMHDKTFSVLRPCERDAASVYVHVFFQGGMRVRL